jgi:hypothetical protein
MIRRRTLALFGLVFMIALAVGADPRAQAGQLPKDALQRILDLSVSVWCVRGGTNSDEH